MTNRFYIITQQVFQMQALQTLFIGLSNKSFKIYKKTISNRIQQIPFQEVYEEFQQIQSDLNCLKKISQNTLSLQNSNWFIKNNEIKQIYQFYRTIKKREKISTETKSKKKKKYFWSSIEELLDTQNNMKEESVNESYISLSLLNQKVNDLVNGNIYTYERKLQLSLKKALKPMEQFCKQFKNYQSLMQKILGSLQGHDFRSRLEYFMKQSLEETKQIYKLVDSNTSTFFSISFKDIKQKLSKTKSFMSERQQSLTKQKIQQQMQGQLKSRITPIQFLTKQQFYYTFGNMHKSYDQDYIYQAVQLGINRLRSFYFPDLKKNILNQLQTVVQIFKRLQMQTKNYSNLSESQLLTCALKSYQAKTYNNQISPQKKRNNSSYKYGNSYNETQYQKVKRQNSGMNEKIIKLDQEITRIKKQNDNYYREKMQEKTKNVRLSKQGQDKRKLEEENTSLKNLLKQRDQQIQKYESSKKIILNQLQESRYKQQEMQMQNKQINDEYTTYRQQQKKEIQQKQDKLMIIEMQVREHKNKIQGKETQIQVHKQKITQYQGQIQKLKEQMERKEEEKVKVNELQVLKKKLNTKQSELEKANFQYNSLNSQHKKLRIMYKAKTQSTQQERTLQYQNAIKEHKLQIQKLTHQLKQQQQHHHQHDHQHQEQQGKLKQLQQYIKSLNTDIKNKKEQLQSIEGSIQQKKKQRQTINQSLIKDNNKNNTINNIQDNTPQQLDNNQGGSHKQIQIQPQLQKRVQLKIQEQPYPQMPAQVQGMKIEKVRLQEQIHTLQQQQSKLKKEIQEHTIISNSIQQQIKYNQTTSKSLQEEVQKHIQDKNRIMQQLKHIQEDKAILLVNKQANNKLVQGIKVSQQANRKVKQEIHHNEQANKRLKQEIEQYQQIIENVIKQIQQNKQANKKLQLEIKDNQQKNSQIVEKIKAIQNKYEAMDKQLKEKQSQHQELSSKCKEEEKKFLKYRKQYSELTNRYSKTQSQIKVKVAQNTKITETLNNKVKEINNYKQQYDKICTSVKELRQQESAIASEVKERAIKLKQLQQSMKSVINKTNINTSNADFKLHDYLFSGNSLQNAQNQKLYLIECVEKVTGRKLKKTKTIYEYPELSAINFHQFIDHKPHYLIVVKLKNNKLIAAYSEEPLVKGQSNRGQGFIASLSNKEMFQPRKNNSQAKVTLYDDYFILFGNSELKIKVHEQQIQSNLGIVYRYYDSGTHKTPEVLFGVTERVQTLHTYEVYQLIFASQSSLF